MAMPCMDMAAFAAKQRQQAFNKLFAFSSAVQSAAGIQPHGHQQQSTSSHAQKKHIGKQLKPLYRVRSAAASAAA